MIMQIANAAYELAAYEVISGAKTFRLAHKTYGTWEVLSYNTKQPTDKCFWGVKSFSTLSAVGAHYKAFRGVGILLH